MDDDPLLAKVVLVGPDGTVAVARLVSDRAPDLSTVELVAWLALAGRRAHGQVHLEEVCPVLVGLLDLAGVVDLVGLVEGRPGEARFDDSRAGRPSYLVRGRPSYPVREGGTMTAAAPTIQVKQVLTVGVPVTDQDRSLHFYVDTLGFGL
jgi:hypothetical protein